MANANLRDKRPWVWDLLSKSSVQGSYAGFEAWEAVRPSTQRKHRGQLHGSFIFPLPGDSAGSSFQVLFFPTNQQLHLQSPQRDFPVTVKSMQADYITTETH